MNVFSAKRLTLSCALSILVTGCAALPSSGPSAGQLVRSTQRAADGSPIVIRDLDLAAVRAIDENAGSPLDEPLQSLRANLPSDRVGPGDVLDIRVYEVGIALFTGAAPVGSDAIDSSPRAHAETFGNVVIDAAGQIRLPYVGPLEVAGLTPAQIALALTNRLRSKSQSPQVLVRVSENMTNVVYAAGSISKPGKYDLTPGGTRLYDVIARAGGVDGAPGDFTVTLTRGGVTVEQRLDLVVPGGAGDITLQPGDRIRFNKRPRSITVFGAAGKVSQIPFTAGGFSLAEAIGQAAGPSDNTADSSAVFLFRNTPIRPSEGSKDLPDAPTQRLIYRLDLTQAQSYFVAQEFKMRDKDLIYVANSRFNQTSKFISMVSQLFTPVLIGRSLTQ